MSAHVVRLRWWDGDESSGLPRDNNTREPRIDISAASLGPSGINGLHAIVSDVTSPWALLEPAAGPPLPFESLAAFADKHPASVIVLPAADAETNVDRAELEPIAHLNFVRLHGYLDGWTGPGWCGLVRPQALAAALLAHQHVPVVDWDFIHRSVVLYMLLTGTCVSAPCSLSTPLPKPPECSPILGSAAFATSYDAVIDLFDALLGSAKFPPMQNRRLLDWIFGIYFGHRLELRGLRTEFEALLASPS